MSKFTRGLKHFVLELIPPFVFFFIAFQLIAFTNSLMLRQYGIDVTTFIEATIGALVVAKVVLLSDLMPFSKPSPGKPLIYNIAWKAGIYVLAAIVVRYIEALIHFYRQNDTLMHANRRMLSEIIWPHFWAIQIWLTVLLFIYCATDTVVRTVGQDKVRALFFGSPGKLAHR